MHHCFVFKSYFITQNLFVIWFDVLSTAVFVIRSLNLYVYVITIILSLYLSVLYLVVLCDFGGLWNH